MREYGVPIERVVCCGGIAEKNDVFMQIYADVIGHPMLIAGSAADAGPRLARSRRRSPRARPTGGHATFEDAQKKMSSLKEKRFRRGPGAARVYDELYAMYRELHDTFGGVDGRDGGPRARS